MLCLTKITIYERLTIPVLLRLKVSIRIVGSTADTFLSELGRRIGQRTDGHRESAFLFQRIAVLIQRHNAVAVLGTFAHTTPEDKI